MDKVKVLQEIKELVGEQLKVILMLLSLTALYLVFMTCRWPPCDTA